MYKEYAQALNANDQVLSWIDSVLKNYLKNNKLDVAQDQVEHIIDYLVSPDAPQKNLTAMSYTDAFKNAEKWMKVQIKKGEHIKETAKDTKVVLDFKDGFKIVQLVVKGISCDIVWLRTMVLVKRFILSEILIICRIVQWKKINK